MVPVSVETFERIPGPWQAWQKEQQLRVDIVYDPDSTVFSAFFVCVLYVVLNLQLFLRPQTQSSCYNTEVDTWNLILENVATVVSSAVFDAVTLLSKVKECEESLTVQTFVEACRLMSQLKGDRVWMPVNDFISSSAQLSSNQRKPLNIRNLEPINFFVSALCSGKSTGALLPESFILLVGRLQKLPLLLDDKPPMWSKALIVNGQKDALLKLETSVRAFLGPQVERQLRAIKVVQDFESEDGKTPAYFAEPWSDKGMVNAGVLAYLDLSSLASVTDILEQIKNYKKARETLCQKLTKEAHEIGSKVNQNKAMFVSVYEKMRKIVQEVNGEKGSEWLSAPSVVTAVDELNKDQERLEHVLKEGHRSMGVKKWWSERGCV